MSYLLYPATLVVSELAADAMMHAPAPSSFTVSLSGTSAAVRLAVRANKEPFMVGSATGPQFMATKGRGLEVVDVVSQDWGVTSEHPGSRTVWALFKVRQA